MPKTDKHAEKGPVERLETKIDNMRATENADRQDDEVKGLSAPITDTDVVKSGQIDPASPPPETAEGKKLNMGQGLNANGEADSKEKFEEGKFEVQGHTKITREAGDSDTGKAAPADVVQQGGGGAIDAKSGKPA